MELDELDVKLPNDKVWGVEDRNGITELFVKKNIPDKYPVGLAEGENQGMDSYSADLQSRIFKAGNPVVKPIIYNFTDTDLYQSWRDVAPKGFFDFCDSSIWNIVKNNWDNNPVKLYTEQGRYNLVLSREYASFSIRKFINSYVFTLGGEAHTMAVCPFAFHSESDFRNKLRNRIDEFKNTIFKYKWRILLVDDHAKKGLASIDKQNKYGKLDFIIKDIDLLDASLKSSIDIATNVDEALNELKNGNRYDIILLDYKLADGHLGTEILEEIKTQNNVYRPGPAGKYAFLFVSGYPDAVHNIMLAKGLHYNTDEWIVGRGACPINTPYLFLYELVEIMQQRVDKLWKHIHMVRKAPNMKGDAERIEGPTAVNFISWLYDPAGVCSIRARCKNAFNAFLKLRSRYDAIKYDVCDGLTHLDDKGEIDTKFVDSREKESWLIRSMFPDVSFFSNIFWEHMQHLVYLTAFGTNRQWGEMWEELLSVSSDLKEAGGADAVKKIRDYILHLKNGE